MRAVVLYSQRRWAAHQDAMAMGFLGISLPDSLICVKLQAFPLVTNWSTSTLVSEKTTSARI